MQISIGHTIFNYFGAMFALNTEATKKTVD
jgi:hypothetical protein